MIAPKIAAIFLAAVSFAATGCRSPARSSRPDRAALRPVSLPDLGAAAEPVRVQLRDRFASLTRTIHDGHAPAVDLAAAYGEMGKLLMAAEYREEAEACFLNAESLTPNQFKWPYYLGHLYRARGDAAQSTAAFERAVQIQPSNVATLVWLGNAYLDQGRPEAAQLLFERALSYPPQSVAALVGLGRAALARSEYPRAVQDFERALALDPREAVIHYLLAMAYRGLGQLDRADAHMRQRGPGEVRPPDPLMGELETALESGTAYEVRGAKALDDRDWKTAAAYFRKGIELAPSEPSLHHKLGTALFLDGDVRGASEQFAEALRLSPTFAKAHYSLGVLLGANGRSVDAIAHLSEAVRDAPTDVEAHLRLAEVLRRSGRAAQSLRHYAEAATLDPRAIDAPLGYALALVDLHRYRDARDRLRDDMKRYPDQPALAHALIRLLAAAPESGARDGQAALALMRDVLAREPRTADVSEMMAMTQAELGQYGEAAAWQREAIAAAESLRRPDLVRRLLDTLARYEHRQPSRTPWLDDNVAR